MYTFRNRKNYKTIFLFYKSLRLFLYVLSFKNIMEKCRILFIFNFIRYFLLTLLSLLDLLVTTKIGVFNKRNSFYFINKLYYFYNRLLGKLYIFLRYIKLHRNILVDINYSVETKNFVDVFLTLEVKCIYDCYLREYMVRYFEIGRSFFEIGDTIEGYTFSQTAMDFKMFRVIIPDLLQKYGLYYEMYNNDESRLYYSNLLFKKFYKYYKQGCYSIWRFYYYFIFILSQKYIRFFDVFSTKDSIGMSNYYYSIIKYVIQCSKMNNLNYENLFLMIYVIFRDKMFSYDAARLDYSFFIQDNNIKKNFV